LVASYSVTNWRPRGSGIESSNLRRQRRRASFGRLIDTGCFCSPLGCNNGPGTPAAADYESDQRHAKKHDCLFKLIDVSDGEKDR
jgi:hypothetical protein